MDGPGHTEAKLDEKPKPSTFGGRKLHDFAIS